MSTVQGNNNAPKERLQEISFIVQTIDCITCSPILRRHLQKIEGVQDVKELPITNKIVVVFDNSRLDRQRLQGVIQEIAKKAGLGGKVVFSR